MSQWTENQFKNTILRTKIPECRLKPTLHYVKFAACFKWKGDENTQMFIVLKVRVTQNGVSDIDFTAIKNLFVCVLQYKCKSHKEPTFQYCSLSVNCS